MLCELFVITIYQCVCSSVVVLRLGILVNLFISKTKRAIAFISCGWYTAPRTSIGELTSFCIHISASMAAVLAGLKSVDFYRKLKRDLQQELTEASIAGAALVHFVPVLVTS